MPSIITAGYGEGQFYPPELDNSIFPVSYAGWSRMMLGLFHVDAAGDISFNDTMVCEGGVWKGDPSWVPSLLQLTNPSSGQPGLEIYLSFGGGAPVADFQRIKSIYDANGGSFANTNFATNVDLLVTTLKDVIVGVDMDCEDTYDAPSFMAFCGMVTDLGLPLTFAPYENSSWWIGVLQQINAAAPGSVVAFNLQCYAGADPTTWSDEITSAIPGFDINGFIIAGIFASLSLDQVGQTLQPFAGKSCVGGAFVWTLDGVIDRWPSESMKLFWAAVIEGLGGPG